MVHPEKILFPCRGLFFSGLRAPGKNGDYSPVFYLAIPLKRYHQFAASAGLISDGYEIPYQDRGVTSLAGLGSIPDDRKWQIAAGFSAQIPALYDHAFRQVVGERYNEIEQEVWMEMAGMALAIAKNLSLPVETAQDLAGTMHTVMTLLFGPEFKSEALEISKDSAVIVVKGCPLLEAGSSIGVEGDCTFHKCMAFMLSGIPRLNKDYSARFVRTMCSGDRQCEVKVARNKPPAPDKNGKT